MTTPEFTNSPEQHVTPEQQLGEVEGHVDELIDSFKARFGEIADDPGVPYRTRTLETGAVQETISQERGATDWLSRTTDTEGNVSFKLSTAWGGPANETSRSWNKGSTTIMQGVPGGEATERSVEAADTRDIEAAMGKITLPDEMLEAERKRTPEAVAERRRENEKFAKIYAPKLGHKALGWIGIKGPLQRRQEKYRNVRRNLGLDIK